MLRKNGFGHPIEMKEQGRRRFSSRPFGDTWVSKPGNENHARNNWNNWNNNIVACHVLASNDGG